MTHGEASPEFIAESQEIVDALNRDLLAAESSARNGEVDPELIDVLQMGGVNVAFGNFGDTTDCDGFFGFIIEAFLGLFSGANVGKMIVHLERGSTPEANDTPPTQPGR